MINPPLKDLKLSLEELKEIAKLLAKKKEVLKAMKTCLRIDY